MLDIETAALLPPDDPLRQEWEARVQQMDPATQVRWRELTQEADELRADLRRIVVPQGIGARSQFDVEMDVAAILPGRDPFRQTWEERVADSPELRNEWERATGEGAVLRSNLIDTPIPERWHEKLLAPSRKAASRLSQPVRWFIAAAAIIVLAVAFRGGLNWYENHEDQSKLDALAALAVPQMNALPEMVIESSDERVVEQSLAKTNIAMKPMVISTRLRGTHLIGGGVTKLGAHQVAFTRWEREGHYFNLYQFIPKDYQLPENFAPHEEDLTKIAGAKGKAWFWSEPDNHCGWVLVADSANVQNPLWWNDAI